jgi:hypothetical protein
MRRRNFAGLSEEKAAAFGGCRLLYFGQPKMARNVVLLEGERLGTKPASRGIHRRDARTIHKHLFY